MDDDYETYTKQIQALVDAVEGGRAEDYLLLQRIEPIRVALTERAARFPYSQQLVKGATTALTKYAKGHSDFYDVCMALSRLKNAGAFERVR